MNIEGREKEMKQIRAQEKREEPDAESIHRALAALERSLCGKANALERKRRSLNHSTHWKARGSQETLRQTAKHLHALRREHHSRRALHTALRGYVLCLEKSCGDAQAEAILPLPKRGLPVVQWKAEGECLVLPAVCTAITNLLDEYDLAQGSERSADCLEHTDSRHGVRIFALTSCGKK
jgi:hypothetical protein